MPTLAIALALAVGVSLGLLGGGGSILTLPILLYAVGLPPKQAIATSLLVVAGASFVAMLAHARQGRVSLRVAAPFGVASMTTSYVAGSLAHHVPGPWLLAGFTAVTLLTGLAMLRRNTPREQGMPSSTKALLAGTGVGSVTGLIGAGGGFLIVPALTMFAGLDMPRAIGTSLLIITLNSLAGFSGYLGHVQLDVHGALLVTGTAALGSLLGSVLAGRVKPAHLRRGFALFILIVGLGMAITQQRMESTMNIESYAPALLGGALIGLSATLLLVLNGRIAGISGIVGGLVQPRRGDVLWRVWFVAGLLAGGVALLVTRPQVFGATTVPAAVLVAAGLLVGFGTRLGSGCTSGHGVCGLSRFSLRSLVATLTFMLSGGLAAYLVQHVLLSTSGVSP